MALHFVGRKAVIVKQMPCYSPPALLILWHTTFSRKNSFNKICMADNEIYIIDDRADYQFLVYSAFKQLKLKYSIKFFEEGQMLRRHLNTLVMNRDFDQLPGMIIVDLKMPGMNGIELLGYLKGLSQTHPRTFDKIAVVVMSDQNDDDKVHRCYKAGADAYLNKPTDFGKLKNMLSKMCKFWLDR
jgi:CheY-like chemotaxis protein